MVIIKFIIGFWRDHKIELEIKFEMKFEIELEKFEAIVCFKTLALSLRVLWKSLKVKNVFLNFFIILWDNFSVEKKCRDTVEIRTCLFGGIKPDKKLKSLDTL